jgi:hypothetical protein
VGPGPEVKSFGIGKRLIVEAWEKVRTNRGAPGVDAVSIGLFEEQLRDNLYRLWNRMSSGSYFPGPVRGVEIPEDHGAGVRLPGVPNTADRVAQTAAAMLLEGKRGSFGAAEDWFVSTETTGTNRKSRWTLRERLISWLPA